ncbi:MAG TPA: MFS transporter [Gemmatimonadaceae bacterium]|nr:MFS transporter [Gemmatimonadaceae bacterium]
MPGATADAAPPAAAPAARFRDVTAAQWRALAAATLGWMFDAMDFMLYVMAIGRLQQYFGFDAARAGLVATATLVTAAAGGLAFGVIADKIGRVRALTITILVYAVCSIGAATSQSLAQLMIWRGLLGLGMGGEWASGAVLVTETWPAALRNKATSLMQSSWAIGMILAALLSGLVLDVLPLGREAWRWLFAAGALPALLAWWVRRSVDEPDVWKANHAAGRLAGNPYRVLFSAALRRRTLLACLLSSLLLFAYWGLFTWLPNLLASPVDQGGAGMSIVKSTAFLIPMQLGAFAGYLSFGPLADRFGRRRIFAAFTVTAAVIVPVYLRLMTSPALLMLLGPVLGFVGHGYWSMLGPLLSELFPTSVRASGQGLGYNSGRIAGAAAPWVMGVLAGIPGIGFVAALGLTSAFYVAAALVVFLLPDSSAKPLEA